MNSFWRNALDITQLAAPKECLGCGANPASVICSSCRSTLPSILGKGCRRCGHPGRHEDVRTCFWCERLKPPPQGALSLYAYQGLGRDFFHAFKFGGYQSLSRKLLRLKTAELVAHLPFQNVDCLTYIPQALDRRLRRTFNPASVIADDLSQLLGLQSRSLLHMRSFQPKMVGRNLEERLKLGRRRFVGKQTNYPQSVILVDDLITSGATMSAADVCLREQGVTSIVWFSLFRKA